MADNLYPQAAPGNRIAVRMPRLPTPGATAAQDENTSTRVNMAAKSSAFRQDLPLLLWQGNCTKA